MSYYVTRNFHSMNPSSLKSQGNSVQTYRTKCSLLRTMYFMVTDSRMEAFGFCERKSSPGEKTQLKIQGKEGSQSVRVSADF